METKATTDIILNCPYEVVARLAEVLQGLPDSPSREIASLHACARILHLASFHMKSSETAGMAGDFIIMAAQIEKVLGDRKVSVFDPYEARTTV